jgi:predicted Ser/Thr protein kinase
MYIYVYKMCVCVLDERQKLFDEVEEEWTERERQAASSLSPGASSRLEEECEGDTSDENEECIVKVLFVCACVRTR